MHSAEKTSNASVLPVDATRVMRHVRYRCVLNGVICTDHHRTTYYFYDQKQSAMSETAAQVFVDGTFGAECQRGSAVAAL